MTQDAVDAARAKLGAGETEKAVKLAWEAASKAAARRDSLTLDELRLVGEEAAIMADDPSTAEEARQLASYCAAAVAVPKRTGFSFFRRPTDPPDEPRIKCPDCAESIAADARVCRFCGYRISPAPE